MKEPCVPLLRSHESCSAPFWTGPRLAPQGELSVVPLDYAVMNYARLTASRQASCLCVTLNWCHVTQCAGFFPSASCLVQTSLSQQVVCKTSAVCLL